MQFVSAKEIEENRKKFGIVEAEDTGPIDARPLYEKLQELAEKKEKEFDAKYASKAPKGLDEEDLSFLAAERRKQEEKLREIEQEERVELSEFQIEQNRAAAAAAAASAALEEPLQGAESAPEVPQISPGSEEVVMTSFISRGGRGKSNEKPVIAPAVQVIAKKKVTKRKKKKKAQNGPSPLGGLLGAY